MFLETSKRELFNFLNRQKANSNNGNYGTLCPRLVGGMCTERCRSDIDCQQNDGIFADLKIFSKCCSNGCGRECILTAVTSFPDLSSSEATKSIQLSINPVSAISSTNNAAQISILPIKPIEKDVSS